MKAETNHYRHWLLDELVRRKAKSPMYSLRAFSRDLGVSRTALSDVLAGKRDFSKKAARKVAERLGFSPRQTHSLMDQIQGVSAAASHTDSVDQAEYLQLQEDQFKLISEWYCVGILTLAQLREHKADPKWIGRRLGISEVEVASALRSLERLGLIEIRRGKLVRTTPPVSAGGVPSAAVRKYHRQNLRLAEQALDGVPVAQRLFGAISMPVNPERLGEAAKLIDEFKDKMAALMDTPSAKQVYTLSIQFFPITKGDLS